MAGIVAVAFAAFNRYGRAFRMCCEKALDQCTAARDPAGQAAGILIRTALMNRFSVLGTAAIVRLTRS
ncbi:MAG TPA: hypothetical protein GX700_19000 [Paracoccus sp.]|nr:hypothetical protein [Paracoccus sp. (in: a-proteobacteria)]